MQQWPLTVCVRSMRRYMQVIWVNIMYKHKPKKQAHTEWCNPNGLLQGINKIKSPLKFSRRLEVINYKFDDYTFKLLDSISSNILKLIEGAVCPIHDYVDTNNKLTLQGLINGQKQVLHYLFYGGRKISGTPTCESKGKAHVCQC